MPITNDVELVPTSTVKDPTACAVTNPLSRHCYYQTPYGEVSADGWLKMNTESIAMPLELPLDARLIAFNGSRLVLLLAPPSSGMNALKPNVGLVSLTTRFDDCIVRQPSAYLLKPSCFQPAIDTTPAFPNPIGPVTVFDMAAAQFATNSEGSLILYYDGTYTVRTYYPKVSRGGTVMTLKPTVTDAAIKRTPTLAISDDGSEQFIGFPPAIAAYDGFVFANNLQACPSGLEAVLTHCDSLRLNDAIGTSVPDYLSVGAVHFETAGIVTFDVQRQEGSNMRFMARSRAPTGVNLLGMGDSFASGEGAYNYRVGTDDDANKCHSSTDNYAYRLGAEGSVACTGARLRDLVAGAIGQHGGKQVGDWPTAWRNTLFAPYPAGRVSQLDALSYYKPATATISIGGNDVGFGDILKACLVPMYDGELRSDCYPSYEDRLELLQAIKSQSANLIKTYLAMKAASPTTHILVVGYPKLVSTDNACRPNVRLSATEITFANQLTDYLNDTIKAAAASAGVGYVSMDDAFAGHELCATGSRISAVNGITYGDDGLAIFGHPIIGQETYHPTWYGQYLMAERIRPRLTGSNPLPAATDAPTIDDKLSILQVPHRNRPIRTVLHDDDLLPDTIDRGKVTILKLNRQAYRLKTGSPLSIEVRSDPQLLTQIIVPAADELTIPLTIPAALQNGFHVIHVYGTTEDGTLIDITKTIDVSHAIEAEVTPTGARFDISVGRMSRAQMAN